MRKVEIVDANTLSGINKKISDLLAFYNVQVFNVNVSNKIGLNGEIDGYIASVIYDEVDFIELNGLQWSAFNSRSKNYGTNFVDECFPTYENLKKMNELFKLDGCRIPTSKEFIDLFKLPHSQVGNCLWFAENKKDLMTEKSIFIKALGYADCVHIIHENKKLYATRVNKNGFERKHFTFPCDGYYYTSSVDGDKIDIFFFRKDEYKIINTSISNDFLFGASVRLVRDL